MLRIGILTLTLLSSFNLVLSQGSNFYQLTKVYRGYFNVPNGRNYISYPTAFQSPGLVSEGLQWYILHPNVSTIPSTAINEYFREWGNYGDHMTDFPPSSSGYYLGATLGRAFNSSTLTIDGTAITPPPLHVIGRLRREWYINGSYYIDHATTSPNQNPSGYIYEGQYGYAFKQFNYNKGIAPIDLNINSNGVSVGFMKSWGGAIGSLIYNDFEYLNRFDAGRLLQLAANREAYGERYNPTEGGDRHSSGSPLISWQISSSVFESDAMPLMWNDPNLNAAAPPEQPFVYGGTFHKRVEVMNNGMTGSRIIKIDATFKPHETTTWGTIQIPALYLNPQIMNLECLS